jgi:flagellar motility protein MotE (MotC chaperone)
MRQVHKEIETRIEELGRLKKVLESEVKRLQDEQERMRTERDRELNHVVKVYEAMSPEEAAPLVETMDEEIVVELLSRMKGKKAGRVLEYVDKDRAVQITERLARRKSAQKLGNR